MQKITPFLMFDGRAEEAMTLYISLFKNSEILSKTLYKANEAGPEGSVMHAIFMLNGQEYMCIDSAVKHAFTFTPSISFYIVCETEDEINTLYQQLSSNGEVMMPLDTYPFSERFGWIADQFGVSWQLDLKKKV